MHGSNNKSNKKDSLNNKLNGRIYLFVCNLHTHWKGDEVQNVIVKQKQFFYHLSRTRTKDVEFFVLFFPMLMTPCS